MDRRARFERRAAASDGHGNERGQWDTLATVWAQLRPGQSAETRDASERSAEQAELRFRSSATAAALKAGDRVIVNGRNWRLLGDPVHVASRSGLLSVRLQREA